MGGSSFERKINNKFLSMQHYFKMSKSDLDSDGFQVVKSKHSSRNKHTKLPKKEVQFKKQESEVNIEQTIRRITSAVGDLQDSEYLKEAFNIVSKILKDKQVKEIVSFGLGQISECNISRYQLAFLLCIRDFCKPQKVLVHDPIFYKGECEVLKHFSFEVIKQNNEGSHVISENCITLVYLPHCPKQLTNNFLWSNWCTNLQNCIIICNSFNSLIDSNPSRILLKSTPYIFKIHQFTSETVLENSFKFTDVFNDTSIHYFPREKLESAPSELWIKSDKPAYESTEEFITSLMVEKLNI